VNSIRAGPSSRAACGTSSRTVPDAISRSPAPPPRSTSRRFRRTPATAAGRSYAPEQAALAHAHVRLIGDRLDGAGLALDANEASPTCFNLRSVQITSSNSSTPRPAVAARRDTRTGARRTPAVAQGRRTAQGHHRCVQGSRAAPSGRGWRPREQRHERETDRITDSHPSQRQNDRGLSAASVERATP